MACLSCKQKVEEALKHVHGVTIKEIDVQKQTVIINLDKNSNNSKSVQDIQSLIEQNTGIKTVVKGLGEHLAAVSEVYGNNIIGVVRFSQLLNKLCLVDGAIDGVEYNKSYALSIHQFGDLSGSNFENIGPVHVSILDKLKSDVKDRSSFRLEISNCDLANCIGRSLAVSNSSNNQIVAGGIVARASPVGSNQKKICVCSGKTIWDERESKLREEKSNHL